MKSRLLKGMALGVLLSLAGCIVREEVVRMPPPLPAAPVEAVPVQPGPAYVWVGGHWAWRGPRRGYVWVPGHWVVPQTPGYVWVPGRWEPRPGGYVWIEGHWRVR